MKSSIFTFAIAAFFALAAAQERPPACGGDCVLPEIKASGCANGGMKTPKYCLLATPIKFDDGTDQPCVCKSQKVKEKIMQCVPTVCKGPDLMAYQNWVNKACTGQAGYPVKLG